MIYFSLFILNPFYSHPINLIVVLSWLMLTHHPLTIAISRHTASYNTDFPDTVCNTDVHIFLYVFIH